MLIIPSAARSVNQRFFRSPDTPQNVRILVIPVSADFMTINGCTGAASQLDNHAKGVCFQLISDDLSVEALLKIAESVHIQR